MKMSIKDLVFKWRGEGNPKRYLFSVAEEMADRLEELEAENAALKEKLNQVVIKWPNGCDKSVPAALRYLAYNDRPSGGEQIYNSLHLEQLADEIEAVTILK